jgi:ATP-binding cassette subfamily C protein
MVARAAIITVRSVTMAQVGLGFIQHIRSRITRRLAAAQWDTVSRLRHSRITHLMGTDIQQVESAANGLLRETLAVVMLTSQVVLAFLLAPTLAALVLGVLLLGAMTLLPMLRRARESGSFITGANLSLIDNVTQFLGALKLAISQNLQDSFTREFEATLDAVKAQQIRFIRQLTISQIAITTLSGLVTLLFVLARMIGPATLLQLETQHIAHTLPAYEKILELENILTASEAVTVVAANSNVVLADGPIIFSKVAFLHNAADTSDAPGGVQDLNLMIEPGSITGITGPSGAGKTTFADLLVGLYPPQSGEILVGGVALRGSAVMAWRNSVSYVAQDPYLFHDTIRQNLLWAKPETDEAALWEVLRIAGAEELVRNATHGLDTVVGERGGLLSGGERQRLCLARAMLRRPHLLVLDEATSAIDIEGENALIKRLLRATPRPTIVMIAHRWESLCHCQRVLVFEGGRLVSGSRNKGAAKQSRL